MEINKTINDKEITFVISGRIDTSNSDVFESALAGVEDYESVVFDFKDLEYISSVGLRILLSTHKKTKGHLKIIHVNDFIMEVFDLTGFSSILNIQG